MSGVCSKTRPSLFSQTLETTSAATGNGQPEPPDHAVSTHAPFQDGPLSLAERLPGLKGRKLQDYVRNTYMMATNVTLSFYLPSGKGDAQHCTSI
jgi:hypothetical protein